MRAVLVGGLGLLVVSALLVPLPVVVVAPATLVDAEQATTVTVSPEFSAATAATPQPVTGTYLAVRELEGPPLLRVANAAVSPNHHVRRRSSAGRDPLDQPPTVAALMGLGLAPARMEGVTLPVDVAVRGDVDAASVGVLLYVFDAASQVDVGQGRRIVGLGTMDSGLRLHCPGPVAASLVAAGQAGADVIVVPSSCPVGERDEAATPATVVTSDSFVEVIDALLAAAGD